MGFRFRKSLRILPGVRLNFSNRGTSVSLGGRGATANVSDRGVRKTVGLPGTGMSYSTFERWSGRAASRAGASRASSGSSSGTWTVIGLVVGLFVGFGGAPIAGAAVAAAGIGIDLLTRPAPLGSGVAPATTMPAEPEVAHDRAGLIAALLDERDALLRQPRSARHAARLQEIEGELRALEGASQ
jgi:hypothetical protein